MTMDDGWGFSRETILREIRRNHKMAVRRSDVINRISTAVEELVKTVQHLLRHGIEALEPGVTRLDVIKDPGSIEDIAGDFAGSPMHIRRQLQKLGRSTVYKVCRYLYDIQHPLESSYVAIRRWNEQEKEEYNEWRSINPGSLHSTRELSEARCCLHTLVRDQLELLKTLSNDFTKAVDSEGEKLMHLLTYCLQTRITVQQLMAEKQLGRDEAALEAGENALRETMHPTVSAHRSTNVPLVEHIESIPALPMCEILVTFRAEIARVKETIEKAIGVHKSVSGL